MELVGVILFQLILLIGFVESTQLNKHKEAQRATSLPPCAACKILIESFKKGMEITSRGKFEGGDAAWEEEKMKSYKRSEVRLVEIQEKLCQEVERGQNQCLSGAEEHEELLEDWWFNKQDSFPDLHAYMCTDTLKVCCPSNHYGPECLPCKGGIENPCGGNGKCKGGGTRKGNGECDCNNGYTGFVCQECGSGFYEAYKDEEKILCDPCHKACDGACSGAGPKACHICASGWMLDREKGCLDVDECIADISPCRRNQLCVNTEGNYTCLKCDRSCNGCTGDGPDMCLECAEGFDLDKTGNCIDSGEAQREDSLTKARYVTYGGLTLATCIILQKHTTAAAIIGIVVAFYISFSEYYLLNMQDPNKPIKPADLGLGPA